MVNRFQGRITVKMSKRKGRFGGMLPIDTLSTSNNCKNTVPTRYTAFRRDPKVVDKLNHLTTLDFLPPEHSLTKKSSQDLSPRKYHSKARPISVDSEDESSRRHDSFETPIRKRQKGIRDVSFTSPIEHGLSPPGRTFSSSGTFRVLSAANRDIEKMHCVLRIVTDVEGIRCSVRWKGAELEGSQTDFLIDCERFFFDTSKSYMGIFLKHTRRINLENGEEPINTKIMVWNSDNEPDKNLVLVKRSIMNSLVKVEVVPDKRDILNRMKNLGLKYQNEAKNKKFWEKPEFQSLGRSVKTRRRTEESGTKIGIPNTEITASTDTTHSTSRDPLTISPSGFYAANNKSISTQPSLKEHSLSNLRRSQRTSRLAITDDSPLDKDQEFEEPEEFKPSLFHKFTDGTTFSVTNLDFKCLYNHDWINDSILDFFVKYWAEESISKGAILRGDIHILSSFFYTKLVSDPSNYYSNVKKWVSNTDLFSKKYIVMPINVNFHWFGCIITNLPSILEFLTREKELLTTSEASPISEDNDELSITPPVVSIFVYDSLRQTHSREVEPLKEFLISYAEDKYGLTLPKGVIKMKTCMVPQQPNMSDCGVHVILNSRKFFENPIMTAEVWRSTKSKGKPTSRAINEYFEKNARVHARKDLREVLRELQKQQIKSGPLKDETAVNDASMDDEHSDIEIIEDIDFYKKNTSEEAIEKSMDNGESCSIDDDKVTSKEEVSDNEKLLKLQSFRPEVRSSAIVEGEDGTGESNSTELYGRDEPVVNTIKNTGPIPTDGTSTNLINTVNNTISKYFRSKKPLTVESSEKESVVDRNINIQKLTLEDASLARPTSQNTEKSYDSSHLIRSGHSFDDRHRKTYKIKSQSDFHEGDNFEGRGVSSNKSGTLHIETDNSDLSDAELTGNITNQSEFNPITSHKEFKNRLSSKAGGRIDQLFERRKLSSSDSVSSSLSS